MIINELLADRYRVQKALDQEVGHSLSRYVAETHNRVNEIAKTLDLNFNYGCPGIILEEETSSKVVNEK